MYIYVCMYMSWDVGVCSRLYAFLYILYVCGFDMYIYMFVCIYLGMLEM